MIKLEKIITFDIVSAPSISNAKLITDEEIKQKKILENMEKRNAIIDELLKED
jgi:hypothetical protein